MAEAALKGTSPLGECTGDFSQQYGLPCKHIMHDLLRIQRDEQGVPVGIEATRPLGLQDVDTFWVLDRNLVK